MSKLFTIVDSFDISGRGLVVASDQTFRTLGDVDVRIGDVIVLRSSERPDRNTTVHGIEHCDPWSPDRVFAILLPPDVDRSDVPNGTEVWKPVANHQSNLG